MLDLQFKLTSMSDRPARALEDTQTQGRKLAVASVQGLDQLRKLVLPDALLGIIGDALPGTRSRSNNSSEIQVLNGGASSLARASAETETTERKALKEALDALLASSCVLCDSAITSIDRPFVNEGEEEM